MRKTLLLLSLIGSIAMAQNNLDQVTGKLPNAKNLLQQETQIAFEKMRESALKDGIDLLIVSGYRSFNRQRQIWNRKYKKYQSQGMSPDQIFDKIVEYSTVPGTSRHHWGTDIDIIDQSASYSGDVLVPDKFHGNGPFCKMKEWMEKNASDFGFELVYTYNENRTGFKYEPWHYSYVPLSRKRMNNYPTAQNLLTFLRDNEIMGMDQISDERILRYYKEHIYGVNLVLLPNHN